MKTLMIGILFLAASAHADVYMGELKKKECSVVKGKDFMAYVKQALGDKKLDVEYDKTGSCGQSAYIMKRDSRKRWAVFPDKTGCQCYLNTLKALDPGK
jgi:hypothetical protein